MGARGPYFRVPKKYSSKDPSDQSDQPTIKAPRAESPTEGWQGWSHRSGMTTGRIGEPVAPRSLMDAPKKANS